MGVIIFNGQSSRDLHVVVEHPPAYETPERDYEVTSIPGRNGDLILDNGSYSNVKRTYEIAIDARDDGFSKTVSEVMGWLRSASGYSRLEDSYDEDFYRMACYRESLTVENLFDQAGRATIAFDCMPQRFLKSGEQAVAFNAPGFITNPTCFTAKPIIRVTMALDSDGTIAIGEQQLNIHGLSEGGGLTVTIDLDCDLQDAAQNGVNWNKYVSGKFPELVPGSNTVTFSGIQSLSIIPRWWTI